MSSTKVEVDLSSAERACVVFSLSQEITLLFIGTLQIAAWLVWVKLREAREHIAVPFDELLLRVVPVHLLWLGPYAG